MKKMLMAILLALNTMPAFGQSILQHYQPGPRLIDGNQLNLMVDQVNNLTGNGTAGSNVKLSNGTVALPSLSFYSDTDTGIYRIGANNIGVGVNGAKVLDIGTTGLGITGLLTTTGPITITSSSALALAVGRQGGTNPAFRVDANTASSLTGLRVTAAGTGAGVAVAVVETGGTNNNLTIDAMGSGTITLGGTSTGNIVLTRATTGLSYSGTGLLTARSGTATPAAASAVAGMCMGSSSICIYWGTGSPNTALTAAKGSLFIATDGSSSSTRMFVNTDGSTAWAAVTTAS